MAGIVITTPKAVITNIRTKDGKIETRLEWAPDFGRRYSANFSRAQAFVDNEVVRFCSARVPFQTGMLQKSGILGSVIGSGKVSYVAPYAARQYYKTAKSRPYDANRGAFWFERGKAIERTRILAGALKIAGGGS